MARSRPLLVLGALLAGLFISPAPAHAVPKTYYLSPSGTNTSSCSGGTTTGAAWRTFTYALPCLRAGDTLLVRGGTFIERFNPTVFRNPGTSSARITVQAYPGERPVVKGYLNIRNADYWTFDGINVTWDGSSKDPLVKLMNGIGWVFKNAEVWGAHSTAAVVVGASSSTSDPPRNWTLSGNCIHHTYPTNGANMDHNIYIHGVDYGAGLIERNVIFYAPNGENIKLGGSDASSRGTGHVTVRNNTMYYAGQNVLVAWKSHDNVIENNIMSKAMGKDWYPNIRGYAVTGSGNIARNNIGYAASRLIFNTDKDSNQISNGVSDRGGNRFPVNPNFKSVSSCGGLAAQAGNAKPEGRHAPIGRAVSGDWNGDGIDTTGYVQNGKWYLRNSNNSGAADLTFTFGSATDRFVVGDWDGDGDATPGLYRNGTWYLRNLFTSDSGRYVVTWGRSSDIPVAGDWDGNGRDTIGLFRSGAWYLRNKLSSDSGRYSTSFGTSTDVPVVGDWNGNGTVTPGIMRANVWYMRASNSSTRSASLTYGQTTDWPIAGDWDGVGGATPGLVRIDEWLLRDSVASTGSTLKYSFPA